MEVTNVSHTRQELGECAKKQSDDISTLEQANDQLQKNTCTLTEQ